MAQLNLVVLYINILTKQFVSINGSPTAVPTQFQGDKPLFLICPVQPVSNNPNQGYTPVSLVGYTANLVMAGTPNAQTPPTPFASLDGMAWTPAVNGFTGIIDMTQPAVATYIGNAPSNTAYLTIDVTDATQDRTTWKQDTFTITASNDAPATGPSGPPVQYLTLAQALNLFVQIGAFPGKQILFQSDDGTKVRQLKCNNDGTDSWNPQ